MQKREKYLERIRPYYDSDLIKSIAGIRRAGKSTLLVQIMEEIKKENSEEQVIFFDFEDFDNSHYLKRPNELYAEIKRRVQALGNKKAYVFIDEVQYLDDYIPVIASIRSSLNASVFITGSTDTLISGELESRLTGRYIEFTVFPFSYLEMASYIGKEDDNAFADYLQWGGFPVRFQEGINPRIAIGDILSSIITRDVLARHKDINSWLFGNFSSYILSYTGNIVSSESLTGYISSKEEKIAASTCYGYLEIMEEANLISIPSRFDIKGKAMLKTKRKVYAADPALVTLQRGLTASINYGAVLETVVFNELISRGYEVSTGKTYRGEIDFVVSNGTERCYVQVAYLLSSDEVVEREFGAYSSVKDSWPKYVISMDSLDFSRDGIIHMNIRDFLTQRKRLAINP